ncbi:MAG: Hsp20/alpha crystallin family protein [Spirochaetes bacterium]|nr:MAG: Hsp20/alpha crystallin family protein [Spirochaetota bacterium]
MSNVIVSDNKTATAREAIMISPAADVYETPNEYVIKADMPGVSRENLEITVENNELRISGKMADVDPENLRYTEFGRYQYGRSFQLGDGIDREKIQASLANGVLTLTLSKSEAVKPRRIEVKVA